MSYYEIIDILLQDVTPPHLFRTRENSDSVYLL